MAGTITISSSYGADGALIGRAVAQQLGVQFFDRAIPVSVARELAVDTDEALARDWRAPGRMERVFAALASVSMPFGMAGTESELYANPDAFRMATEEVLRKIADSDGGVVLGRASMVVLTDRPDVLSVRLDGPVEERIRRAVERSGMDDATVRHEQRVTDEARESYAQTFYGVSQRDASLYHLSLDSVALSHATCVEIILAAAADRLGLRPPPNPA